jgi:hypothetical protein
MVHLFTPDLLRWRLNPYVVAVRVSNVHQQVHSHLTSIAAESTAASVDAHRSGLLLHQPGIHIEVLDFVVVLSWSWPLTRI